MLWEEWVYQWHLSRKFQVLFHIRSLVSADLPLVRAGYDETILSLVDITLDHVQDKLKGDAVNTWVLWAMAQRVNRRIKLRTCVR